MERGNPPMQSVYVHFVKLIIREQQTIKKLHIFEILDTEDNKILKLLQSAKDHKAILDLFARRISLYKRCAEQTHDRLERGIIEAKKMVIMGEVGLLSAQYDMQAELRKINARLDSLGVTSPNQKT